MKLIRAFLLGIRERHLNVTTHHATERERNAYDHGRNIARRGK